MHYTQVHSEANPTYMRVSRIRPTKYTSEIDLQAKQVEHKSANKFNHDFSHKESLRLELKRNCRTLSHITFISCQSQYSTITWKTSAETALQGLKPIAKRSKNPTVWDRKLNWAVHYNRVHSVVSIEESKPTCRRPGWICPTKCTSEIDLQAKKK